MLSHVWYFVSIVIFSRVYCAVSSYYNFSTCFQFLVAPRGSGKNRARKANASRRRSERCNFRTSGRLARRWNGEEKVEWPKREIETHTANGHFYSTTIDSSFKNHASERASESGEKVLHFNTLAFTINRISPAVVLIPHFQKLKILLTVPFTRNSSTISEIKWDKMRWSQKIV